MPYDLTVQKSFALGGKNFTHQETITQEGFDGIADTIPVAWAGELTTRTDANTGTVTMDDDDHEIDTGEKVDLYWTGGQRRYMTVGTVSTTSVPIDLGSGTDLPVAETAVIVCHVVEKEISVDADDVAAWLASADFSRCQFVVMGLDTQRGELTTRTDNNTGELTMDSGSHTVATGDIVDLFWDGGGKRLSMTVGTVSGTAVPIDLGYGDNLPALNTTDIRVVVVGDPSVEQLAIHLDENQCYEWVSGISIGANPLAGEKLTSIRMSIADVASAREGRFSALISA